MIKSHLNIPTLIFDSTNPWAPKLKSLQSMSLRNKISYTQRIMHWSLSFSSIIFFFFFALSPPNAIYCFAWGISVSFHCEDKSSFQTMQFSLSIHLQEKVKANQKWRLHNDCERLQQNAEGVSIKHFLLSADFFLLCMFLCSIKQNWEIV